MRFDEAIEGFRRWLELSRAPSTARYYVQTVERFARFCDKKDTDEITLMDVVNFLGQYRNKRTAAKYAHALRRFFLFVGRQDLAYTMPFPREFKRREPPVLDEEEIKRAIERLVDPMERAAIAVAYWCGLRISELLLLKREDYDPQAKTIKVTRVKLKGGAREVQELPVADWVARHIEAYLGTRRDDDPRMFPVSHEMIRRMFKRFAKMIGRPDLTFHSLRHARATNLAAQGHDPATIASWLHHLNPATTMIYIHLAAKHLRKVLESSIPKEV